MSRPTSPVTVAGGVAWLRVAVGAVLTITPRSVLRLQATDEPSGALVLMARTVGIRDVVVGIGSLAALRSGSDVDLRRWIRAGLLSDVLDVLAGALSARLVGGRDASVSALVPVPVIVADVYALSSMREGVRAQSN